MSGMNSIMTIKIWHISWAWVNNSASWRLWTTKKYEPFKYLGRWLQRRSYAYNIHWNPCFSHNLENSLDQSRRRRRCRVYGSGIKTNKTKKLKIEKLCHNTGKMETGNLMSMAQKICKAYKKICGWCSKLKYYYNYIQREWRDKQKHFNYHISCEGQWQPR